MRILTAFLFVLITASTAMAGNIRWLDSPDKAKPEAAKSGRAIFVYCTSKPGTSEGCDNWAKDVISKPEVTAALANYECVRWIYDPSVIRWTKAHGNTNDDPTILAYILDPKGEMLEKAEWNQLGSQYGLANWLNQWSVASFPVVNVNDFPNLKTQAADAAAKQLGKAMAGVRPLIKGDDKTAAEARIMFDKLFAYAGWKQGRSATLKEKSPAIALQLLAEVAKDFAGDIIGDQAQTTCEELKKDPKFQAEIKARAALDKALTITANCKPCVSGQEPDLVKCFRCRAKNQATYDLLVVTLKKIVKDFPETVAGKETAKLYEELSLPPAGKK